MLTWTVLHVINAMDNSTNDTCPTAEESSVIFIPSIKTMCSGDDVIVHLEDFGKLSSRAYCGIVLGVYMPLLLIGCAMMCLMMYSVCKAREYCCFAPCFKQRVQNIKEWLHNRKILVNHNIALFELNRICISLGFESFGKSLIFSALSEERHVILEQCAQNNDEGLNSQSETSENHHFTVANLTQQKAVYTILKFTPQPDTVFICHLISQHPQRVSSPGLISFNNLCDDDDCLERYHPQCIHTAGTISDALCAMSTEQKDEVLTIPGLRYGVIKAGEV